MPETSAGVICNRCETFYEQMPLVGCRVCGLGSTFRVRKAVPAPPAVQGEPGEAVRELAAKLRSCAHPDKYETLIIAHIAPLLAKARASNDGLREYLNADMDEDMKWRIAAINTDAELARWEPKP